MAEQAATLVIFAHPVLERARVAPGLLAAAEGIDGIEIRDLYELYPDFTIDVEAEQAALTRHQRIVLQFPFFWYSAPALLKEWLDLVLTHGWAYGEAGLALKGKVMACAISTGGGRTAYQTKGHNRFTIAEFLRPFDQTAHLCNMRWGKPFVVHGAAVLTEADLKREAERYADYLKGPL
ncbi:MAG TPA: NAD(P)H-dependent oxidoreductase [Caulobacteraceae bacterium]|jgi:glutathione-regulated potassium-efflux system ancillary protein KefG|nr:NAD(P)H-dependent oxidoreductase [Caulobacteraceae bacterium]